MRARIIFLILGVMTNVCANAYYSYSPYAYCKCNPINYTDPNGMTVVAHGKEEQDMIMFTLPPDVYEYLKFDENGMLDVITLSLYANESESQNFSDLLAMASSEEYIFEVYLSQTYQYLDENGNMQEYTFDLEPDLNPEPSSMFSRTGEWGYVGHTNLPGLSTEFNNSTNGNIQIFVYSQLSVPGRAQIFCHEGYGHGYLYMISGGDPKIHGHQNINLGEGYRETNKVLESHINNAIYETVKFMSR